MTRDEIVREAFRVWGKSRYRNTSLSALADALDVSKAALYHHFSSKDELCGAMFDSFFDSFSAHLCPFFDAAVSCAQPGADGGDARRAALRFNREVAAFFARNPWHFLFSLIKVHGNERSIADFAERLKERGIDFDRLQSLLTRDGGYPQKFWLITTGTLCIVAAFLKKTGEEGRPPTEEEVEEIVKRVDAFTKSGLGLRKPKVDALDWERLESEAEAAWKDEGEGGGEGSACDGRKKLMRAVAGAVAVAGPWAASMAMVAEKSGLSKSGLYAHFESKLDMICQLFLGEFDRIITRARELSTHSDVPEEQLYLAVRCVAGGLKTEPELLAALDSFRLRNLDMEAVKRLKTKYESTNRTTEVFSEIRNSDGTPMLDESMAGLVLFLITSTLMRKPKDMSYTEIPNESFRTLYRFIALGAEAD
jgi:AcrR family transcriptional regulator